ncbi:lactate utilization protein [Marinobacter halodurans]|uniref:Lactate utilization protein n=1 Tax=Marinobacter halodurans TaxID=2528979 RepID=A0ABY1ZJA8_9GAMM|nr:LUD domain-containing protein [Marinobacter halodurans]TBW52891.1 lactate utilization protein [Marinobacter halodurans]
MKPRDRILSRLRHGRAASPAAPYPAPQAQATADSAPDIDAMVTALQAAHAEVFRMDESAWPDHLASLAEQRAWQQWWVGRDEVASTWQAHGSAPSVTVFEDWERQKSTLFESAPIGLSLAQGGIADTGTLIVESGSAVPRTLSLVPPVHVVVVRENSLFPDMATAMVHYSRHGMPTNLIFISGPSKTADIQQTMAYGAHGPRELIVYLCR